jgi:hypothetical protein
MLKRVKDGLSFANVCSFLALMIAVGTGSAYAADTIFSTDIVDGEVKSVDIADNAVGPAKIPSGGVGLAELATGAVSSTKIADGSVSAYDLADNAVNSAHIQTEAVGGIEIAPGAVKGEEILDSSIGTADLAGGAVGNVDIATNAVGPSKVLDNSLTFTDLKGGEKSGKLNLAYNSVPQGTCVALMSTVAGAQQGDIVLVSVQANVHPGIQVSSQQVEAPDTIDLRVCNFSNAPSPEFVNAPLKVVTLR